MSMSIHAVGYRSEDETWRKMKTIWEACEKAGVNIPREVDAFFNGENPTGLPGMEVDLGSACSTWEDDYRKGYEIDVTKLPDGIRYVRVYCSY